MFNLIFGFLALVFFCYSLFELFSIYSYIKKYDIVKKEIILLKNENHSRFFAKESVLQKNYSESLVDSVIEEVYS